MKRKETRIFCSIVMAAVLRRTVAGFTSIKAPPSAGRSARATPQFPAGVLWRKEPPTCRAMSSYDFDDDEGSEQLIADRTENDDGINGVNGFSSLRYTQALDSVGIDLRDLKQVHHLPKRKTVSTNDVFCNREIRLGGIQAIGFDMDFTLVQYKQPAFDRLAFDGAKEKLVEKLGYPEEVLDFEYDHTFWARGLIIDIQRGNFIKSDRHKYARVAYHGFDPISKTTRKHLYSRAFNKVVSFSEKNFVNMDTLFQFVDAHLFASLVELKDKGDHEFLDFKTYEEIYREIRQSVDLCHRDGVIKDEVAQNPEKYIVNDPGMISMLQKYKDAGVKVFLLTNSFWEYTSQAMNYLYHGKHVDEETKKRNEWLELFDLAIVGSCKPQYMLDPYLALFRVNPADESLFNTDGLFDIEALGPNGAKLFLDQGKTFQGGNWKHLHAMLEIEAGEEILYVGDHLYSDVLRSKRTLGWRSAFIIPELEKEMTVYKERLPILKKIYELRQLREELAVFADTVRVGTKSADEIDEQLREIEEDDLLVRAKLTTLAESWHESFHPVWGSMFNAGYQDSRFSYYVENYACLYTSKASNLGLPSTSRAFRTISEKMPHDKFIADELTDLVEKDPWYLD